MIPVVGKQTIYIGTIATINLLGNKFSNVYNTHIRVLQPFLQLVNVSNKKKKKKHNITHKKFRNQIKYKNVYICR